MEPGEPGGQESQVEPEEEPEEKRSQKHPGTQEEKVGGFQHIFIESDRPGILE